MNRRRFLRTCLSGLALPGVPRRREPAPAALPLFNCLVADCQYQGGRILINTLCPGDRLRLVRETANPHAPPGHRRPQPSRPKTGLCSPRPQRNPVLPPRPGQKAPCPGQGRRSGGTTMGDAGDNCGFQPGKVIPRNSGRKKSKKKPMPPNLAPAETNTRRIHPRRCQKLTSDTVEFGQWRSQVVPPSVYGWAYGTSPGLHRPGRARRSTDADMKRNMAGANDDVQLQIVYESNRLRLVDDGKPIMNIRS